MTTCFFTPKDQQIKWPFFCLADDRQSPGTCLMSVISYDTHNPWLVAWRENRQTPAARCFLTAGQRPHDAVMSATASTPDTDTAQGRDTTVTYRYSSHARGDPAVASGRSERGLLRQAYVLQSQRQIPRPRRRRSFTIIANTTLSLEKQFQTLIYDTRCFLRYK